MSGIAVRGTENAPPETTPENDSDDEQLSGFTQLVGDAMMFTDDPALKVPVTIGVVALVFNNALCVAVIGRKDNVVEP